MSSEADCIVTRDLDVCGAGNGAWFWVRIYSGHVLGLAADTQCVIGFSSATFAQCGRVYLSPCVRLSGSKEL